MLEDGNAPIVPVALRTVADAVGGMAALAERTGLSLATLYRTLSDMRSVIGLTALVMGIIACGGPNAPGHAASPVPSA